MSELGIRTKEGTANCGSERRVGTIGTWTSGLRESSDKAVVQETSKRIEAARIKALLEALLNVPSANVIFLAEKDYGNWKDASLHKHL